MPAANVGGTERLITLNDVPFETIGWNTEPGETIQHAGSVTFKPVPGNGGTLVSVHLQYAAPGGRAAPWLARLGGEDPARLTRDGLQPLKRHLEVESASGPVH